MAGARNRADAERIRGRELSGPIAKPSDLAAISSDIERRLWLPPERLKVWEWAEKHRYLSRQQTSKDRVGYWRNDRAPYLVPIMHLCVRVGIQMLTILKASQIGVSEAIRNVLGFLAEREPDPALLILPDKDKGKEIIHDRLMPMMRETKVLRDLSTGRRWDSKNSQLTLANGWVLRLGYSGSIGSVASHPARFCFCDERSKFQPDGKISIADSIEARTTTYDDSLVVNVSTPGAEPDPTAELVEAATIKLYFHCPCPHCGEFQVWTFDGPCHLAWEPKKETSPDKNERAAKVIAEGTAWMQCGNPRCIELHPEGKGRIYDEHKADSVRRGYVGTADGSWKIFCDGREEGTKPLGTHAAVTVPAFVSLAPKHRFTYIASKWIRAEGDPIATRGVYNELFASVYRPATGPTPTVDQFKARCRPDPVTLWVPPPQGILPLWATRILMTVDTQKDHFWYVIRAWGHAFRSRRLKHGRVLSFDELRELFYRTTWRYENSAYPPLGIHMLGIDSGGGIRRTDEFGFDGSRTSDVYQFCQTDPAWLKPMKGEGRRRADQPRRLRKIDHAPPDKRKEQFPVLLNFFDAIYHEDILMSYIAQKVPVVNYATGEISATQEEDLWQLNDDPDEEYCRHMANMKRVQGKKDELYAPKTPNARHDLRDCEVEQVALAHGAGDVRIAESPIERAARLQLERRPAVTGGTTMPDGRSWLPTK